MSETERVYRVLALDGGGMKGLFPAAFLATIEDSIGDSISNYFDLIVGTSTGGIIALGLGAGLPAAAIADFYETMGLQVFGKPRNRVAQIFASKYQSKPLRTALESVIGGKKLGESKTRLVVPSVDLDTGRSISTRRLILSASRETTKFLCSMLLSPQRPRPPIFRLTAARTAYCWLMVGYGQTTQWG